MTIAIQGERGSFHDEAAQRFYGSDAAMRCCDSFAEVFRTLDSCESEHAVVAIENSLYGSINEVYDLLESHHFRIYGEIYVRVEQQLIGLSGADISAITAVYSHPVALAQCEKFLESQLPHAKIVHHADTAGAVEYIQSRANPRLAAIASRSAAELYGAQILQSNIEDNHQNYTRFVAISPATHAAPLPNADKASLVFETNHTPGSLARILAIFAEAGINLTKLQSRPILGKVWNYRFYVDLEISPELLAELLPRVEHEAASVTILGTYERGSLEQSFNV